MKQQRMQYKTFVILGLSILAIFVVRTALATSGNPPMLNDLFSLITLAGSLAVWIAGRHSLQKSDWAVAISLGIIVGVSMYFATLFTPYPFLGIIRDNLGQAVLRGFSVTLAGLGGLVIMRQGGPVKIMAAAGEWTKAIRGIIYGLAIGLPLAAINIFALQITQGQGIFWQNPLAALLDALQPGIVEEVIYRYALWGLMWLVLRTSIPQQSTALAGLLATLVHTYQHFDVLFVQSPLVALGMGLAMAIIWGLPPFFLASYRGLESAVAFHWIQDVGRFLAGF